MSIKSTTFKPRLVYVYRINDPTHQGLLKVGETTLDYDDLNYFTLKPNSKELNNAADNRILQDAQTMGIKYDLIHTEISAYVKDGSLKIFEDHEVHHILDKSGIKKEIFDKDHKANEWYYTDLETVKKAIQAAKEERTALTANEISTDKNPIIFRPEQRDAIDRTKKQFNKKHSSNHMLWNAKMRFGKTLSALQVIKECNFSRTLILTHRPVVDKGWFEDYEKIFYDSQNFLYGSKNYGASIEECETAFENNGKYIYFASIQDMRGSTLVGGTFEKNEKIFNINWDLIIIDEAHEGTQTELGKNVLNTCCKEKTKVLHLSGTPFNLMNDFNQDEIFTWDYVMEQKAKKEWDELHKGDPNPYECLPKLNIYTYDLGKLFPDYADAEIVFKFKEFFRTKEDGSFVHETNIKQFLDLLTKEDKDSNYPFSTQKYRDDFRHSLWVVPGVREAKALSILLQKHPVFSQFRIANVAGDGDEEEEEKEALKKVENAIGPHPEETYSITLSCGRLTTGVSVKPWTACFMLSGSYNTAASSYMQTIFRVQTPAIIAGKQKTECFVFDFAPDRTLKVMAEAAKISAKAGQTSNNDRVILGELLNFCPIIGFDGSQMIEYDTETMLGALKKVYVERVVRNGFEEGYLYNNNLLKLNEDELKKFANLKSIIGTTKAMPKTGDIDINKQGFTEEEVEETGEQSSQKEKHIDPNEEERRRKLEEARKLRESAISILRGISIRMPLLIYGAELNTDEDGNEEEININNFTQIVDDISWKEFMPDGVTKEIFDSFKQYYDPEIFQQSGKRIREIARAADSLNIEERIERIGTLFNTFRNPDKETVLTPWRVVNMHLSDCLGGWCFYDNNFEKTITEPRLIEHDEVTKSVFNKNTKILEMNSKSGLYALYCTYSVYKAREKLEIGTNASDSIKKELWNDVLKNNIFVLCKTPMAKSITNRTLKGFENTTANTKYYEDLIYQLKTDNYTFINNIKKSEFWNIKGSISMTFDAIVGNPPYQEMDGGAGTSAGAVYNLFVDNAKLINPKYISMIMPARWYAGGKGLDDFRESMLNDKKIKSLFDFPNCNDLFPTVDIAGGICYFLRNDKNNENCIITSKTNGTEIVSKRKLNEYEIFIRDNRAIEIIKKLSSKTKETLENRVSSRKPFGLPTNYTPKTKGIPCWFIQKIGKQFADEKDVDDSNKLLNKWKFIAPKAPIAGQTDFTKPVGFYYDGNTKIAEPGECCTESFIVLGAFDTKEEALNYKSYILTKVVRFLLLQAVVSQDVTKKCFCFIPDLGHYNEKFNDAKLCKLWNITEEEWKYIDSRICNIKGNK